MAPTTDRGKLALARKHGRAAIVAIRDALMQGGPSTYSYAQFSAHSLVIAGIGDDVVIRATPETPGGSPNGKVRITLRRSGQALRQWPERSAGVPTAEIIATTIDMLTRFSVDDGARADRGHSRYLCARAERTLQATRDDVKVLSVSEGTAGSVRVLVDITSRAALDSIVEALQQRSA